MRGQKILLDVDLAAIYGVTTKALNQALKRNADRFPADFVFQLTSGEKTEVVTICDHLSRLKFSPVLPLAFTEHGAIIRVNPRSSAVKQVPGGLGHRASEASEWSEVSNLCVLGVSVAPFHLGENLRHLRTTN